jgi:hypothetical protein
VEKLTCWHAYLAALHTTLYVLNIRISVSSLARELIFLGLVGTGEMRGLGVVEAFLTACHCGCLDSVDNGRALGRDLYVFLVATEKYA